MTLQTFSRKNLAEIDEELGRNDVGILKFLCSDVLPTKDLQNAKRSIEVFEALERKGKISPGNIDYLLQCLYHMNRPGLIKKLGYKDEAIATHLRSIENWKITPYRVLLYKITEDLDRIDLDTIKYSLQEEHGMKRSQIDRVKSGLDMMDILEKEGLLSPTDTVYLETLILQVLERVDLRHLFEEYKGMSSPQAMEIQQSSNVVATSQGRHEMLTSSTAQPPMVPATGHANQQIRTHGTHLHPMEIQNTNLNQDNPESVLPGNQPGISQSRTLNQLQPAQNQDNLDSLPPGNQQMATQSGTLNQPQPALRKYKMDAVPRGICLIINNEKFRDPRLNRVGSSFDAEKIHKTFLKRQFTIRQKNNVTGEEIKSILYGISRENHGHYDAFVVCILSHGSEGTVKGVDSVEIQIGDLTSCFKSASCKSLEGKPKVFFIQACQGTQKLKVPIPKVTKPNLSDTDANNAIHQQDKKTPLIPGEPDFLLGFATLPGYVAYRRKTRGSIYIEKLTNAIDTLGDRCDILSLLTHVNDEVCDEVLDIPQNRGGVEDQELVVQRFRACSAPLPTLRKQLFL